MSRHGIKDLQENLLHISQCLGAKGQHSLQVGHHAALKEINFSRLNEIKPRKTDNIIVRFKHQREFRFKKLESHNELLDFSNSCCLSKIVQYKGTITNKIFIFEPRQSGTSAEKKQVTQKMCIMKIMILIIQNQQYC